MNFLGNPDHPLALLAFLTLAAVLGIAVWMLISFLRKPGHRHPMKGQRERNIAEIRDEAGEPPTPK